MAAAQQRSKTPPGITAKQAERVPSPAPFLQELARYIKASRVCRIGYGLFLKTIPEKNPASSPNKNSGE